MTDPLAFQFDDPTDPVLRRDPSAEFARSFPGPHYVVLRVEDAYQLGDLLADMQAYPDGDLLTPTLENQVRAVPVAVLDEWPPA